MVCMCCGDSSLGYTRHVDCLVSTDSTLCLIDHIDYSILLGHGDNNLEVHALLKNIFEVDWDSFDTARKSKRPTTKGKSIA